MTIFFFVSGGGLISDERIKFEYYLYYILNKEVKLDHEMVLGYDFSTREIRPDYLPESVHGGAINFHQPS